MEQKKRRQDESITIQIWGDYEFKLFPGTQSTKPNVHFKFLNPDTGKKERKRVLQGLKKGAPITTLKKEAKEIVADLIDLLSKGWNPIENTFNELPISPLSPIIECIEYWLKERQRMVENNAMRPKGLKMNQYLMDYFKAWLKLRGYLQRKPNTFNKVDIENFLQHTAFERKWGKVSYNCYRMDLGTFFNFLVTLKITPENPVQYVEKKNTKKDSSRFKIYEKDELQDVTKLLAKDKAYFGLYVASKLVFHYNIRPCELTRMKIQDIDFGKRTLKLLPENTKNENEANFQLSDEMYNLLDDLTANYPVEHYIFGHRCKPAAHQIHEDYFGQKWRWFRHKYNLPTHLKLYALKHSSDWYDLESGVSIQTIGERNRHANPNVTIAYVKERLNKGVIKPSTLSLF